MTKDLSNCEGTIQYELEKYTNELTYVTNKEDLLTIIDNVASKELKGPKTLQKLNVFKRIVKRSTFEKALYSVYNFFLAGEGLRVIY